MSERGSVDPSAGEGEWLAELAATQHDGGFACDFLVEAFRGPEVSVDRLSDGRAVLRAQQFQGLPDSNALLDRADALLILVNGAAAVAVHIYKPVRAAAALRPLANGAYSRSVRVVSPTMSATGYVGTIRTLVDGIPSAPDQRANLSEWIARCATDRALSDALMLIPGDAGRWCQLYKVYEAIERTGQPSQLERRGIATVADIRRFKASANDSIADLIGARHADGKPQGAYLRIGLPDAELWVRGVVARYAAWQPPGRG